MHQAAIRAYVDGQPRMISDPEHSYVRIMDYQDYRSLGDAAILKILQTRHIVTIGSPVRNSEFNEETLALLGSIDRACTIHGSWRCIGYFVEKLIDMLT